MSTPATPDPQLSLGGTANVGGSARPHNIHRGTTSTVVNQSNPGNDIANPEEKTVIWKCIVMDVALLLLVLIMILWPWAFFGVVQAKHGLQMHVRLAEITEQYPQKVGAVVTFLGTIIRLIATFLFGKMIVRFGQELIAASLDQKVTVFGVSALLAFRHSSMVWGIGQWRQMKNGRGRWAILALLLGCLGAFALVPTGIAGLITPGQFNKTANLIGTELNFASTDPECLAWLEENTVANTCDWKSLSGTQFTTCLGENQMLDVLDSGRAHMLSVINRTETSSLTQLGGEGGIRFLGSAKGVLPIGPNGVLAFNNLDNASNPFLDDVVRRRMVSYNYTLTQQGLESTVRCIYDNTSTISAEPIEYLNSTAIMASTGTCDPAAGLEDFLGLDSYITANTDNTLMYWACKQTPQSVSSDPTYFFYLRGRVNYEESIGNITCQISPIHAHNYQVEYLSSSRYFTTQTATGIAQAPLPFLFSRYIERAIAALGDVVSEGQNWSANLVAEAVFSLGAKELNLSTREKDSKYLQLYEAMIQGMLEYEITYSRLVYNVIAALNQTAPPRTCTRSVDGQVSYAVRGWYIQDAATQAGLLIPMTLINMASFSLLIACFALGKFKYKYNFDATDNIALLAAIVPEEDRPKPGEIEWRNKVNYPQTQSIQPV